MNIFSNLGITELILILLFALLVVGPERLPELGRKLGKTLRDVRKAYDNLARDLGPEFSSLQETTRELSESLNSVRSIPQDMVNTMVKAADLEDTVQELKDVGDSVGKFGQTLSSAQRTIKDPVGTAVSTARGALLPGKDKVQETAIATGTNDDSMAAEEGTEVQQGAVRAEERAEAEAEPATAGTSAEAQEGETTAEAVAEPVTGDAAKESMVIAGDPEEQADD